MPGTAERAGVPVNANFVVLLVALPEESVLPEELAAEELLVEEPESVESEQPPVSEVTRIRNAPKNAVDG